MKQNAIITTKGHANSVIFSRPQIRAILSIKYVQMIIYTNMTR